MAWVALTAAVPPRVGDKGDLNLLKIGPQLQPYAAMRELSRRCPSRHPALGRLAKNAL